MIAENKERLVYSVYDLVDLLGLSISSVYKGINDNEIPYVRVGGRILIPKKMLDEWLSKRESQTTEAIKKCKREHSGGTEHATKGSSKNLCQTVTEQT